MCGARVLERLESTAISGDNSSTRRYEPDGRRVSRTTIRTNQPSAFERILMMAGTQSLRTHLITELRDLLDAEQQLTKVLPDFAQRASIPALRTAFEEHLRETESQINRLKEALDVLGEPAQPTRCEGMQGLVQEGNAVIGNTPRGALRDAIMITSAQKVEHYEMASYGTARTYAQVLGEPQVVRLLQDTLDEEKNADATLTEIAEGKVNEKAAEEWHRVAGGLLEHTAALAGKAVGLGAHTVKRAAGAVGLGRRPRRGESSTTVLEQVTSSLNRAVDVGSDSARNVADKARSQARPVPPSSQRSSRKPIARKTSQKRGRPSATGRTQKSGPNK
jgi:ferritin-like metal-binding protein YciE